MNLLLGTVVGVRQPVDFKTGAVKDSYEIGVQIPVENGFDEEFTTLKVKINNEQKANGLQAVYEKFKGNELYIPVRISSWSMNDKHGLTYYLAGDGRPVSLKKAS